MYRSGCSNNSRHVLAPAAAKFPDVTGEAWYYDYVMSAYGQSIIDGYDNGYFGPADPVTRAQIAKLIINSQNPVERAPEIEEENDEQLHEAAESGLLVSLSP